MPETYGEDKEMGLDRIRNEEIERRERIEETHAYRVDRRVL